MKLVDSLRLTILAVAFLSLVRTEGYAKDDYPEISSIQCDISHPCAPPLECISFPRLGMRCAKPGPCSYFRCPPETSCGVAESYPPQLICGGTCKGSHCGDTVSHAPGPPPDEPLDKRP